ncbi:MAG: YitT family protein [Oscillospiraceae bacterium]|nr:YitT family protein [Oscillospiraceae bacterium]
MEMPANPRSARLRHLFFKYCMIALGSVVYAIGFQYFMFPNDIVSGGVTGIAMILNHFTRWPVGMTVLVLNIPLFVIAWRHFGADYLVGSLVGTAVSSVCVDIFASTGIVATTDPMLGSIIGGVIKGAGMGMIYYVGASTGGIDIVAKMLRQKYQQINFGTIVLILDVVIVSAYAFVLQKYESAMYSLIGMYVVSKVVDLALYGFDNSSLCYIVSEKSEELAREIISGHVHRGVTILEGEGAYSHQTKHVIMCVIKRTQIGELRRLVRRVDERAFFIVTDAKNVFGNGFESISEVR